MILALLCLVLSGVNFVFVSSDNPKWVRVLSAFGAAWCAACGGFCLRGCF